MLLFVAHFVVLQKDIWYAKEAPYEVVRTTEAKSIHSQLFVAEDANHAYLKATEMIEGLGDANHDGDGDLTEYIGLGIYDMDEVFLGELSLDEQLQGPYGVDVGLIDWKSSEPEVRPREQLSIFLHRLPSQL